MVVELFIYCREVEGVRLVRIFEDFKNRED